MGKLRLPYYRAHKKWASCACPTTGRIKNEQAALALLQTKKSGRVNSADYILGIQTLAGWEFCWDRQARAVAEVRHSHRIRFQRRKNELDRFFHLRVALDARVVRRDVDVVVGIGAVIFDAPADVDEPKRKLGLRRHGAVHQRMTRPDADDAAPRAFADQRSEPVQFEAVAKNVAVGPRVLVGDAHHR